MGRKSLAFTLLLLFLFQEDSIAAVDRVWTCGGFDCSRLISGAGDTLNAAGADSTIACKTGTTAAMPATCTTGECYFVTNPTVVGKNLFGCTATNTWNLLGDGGSAGSTSFSALTAGTNSNAGYMIVGGGTAIASNGGAIVATDLDCTGCVADTELASNYSGVGPQCLYGTVINQLNDNAAPTCAQVDHAATDNLVAPADDHTQYPLSAGRTNGQLLRGGLAAGDDLLLDATNATADANSNIKFFSPIEFFPGSKTFSEEDGWNITNEDFISVKPATVITVTSADAAGDSRQPSFLAFGGEFSYEGTVQPYALAGPNIFANYGVMSANHAIGMTGVATFFASMRLSPDAGVAYTLSESLFGYGNGSFYEHTKFGGPGTYVAGAVWNQFYAQGIIGTTEGDVTIHTLNAFRCAKPAIDTGSTLTTRKCFVVNDHTEATTSPALTPGKTIGIENAALTTFPPREVLHTGVISLTTSLNPRTTMANLNINGIGDVMTACPAIATGESGQILTLFYDGYNGASKTLTIRDDDHSSGVAGCSKVALAGCGTSVACSVTIGKHDTLTLVYNSVLARWVEISRGNNAGSVTVNPPQAIVIASAGTTIAPTNEVLMISTTVDRTMTPCPPISAGEDGQQIQLVGTSVDGTEIVLPDGGAQSPACPLGLNLDALVRNIGYGDVLSLVYSTAMQRWSESGYTGH